MFCIQFPMIQKCVVFKFKTFGWKFRNPKLWKNGGSVIWLLLLNILSQIWAGLSWGDLSRNPFNNTEAPPCPRVSYAPEGESLADIVELFADDHRTWQKELFNGWEKIQMNGYDPKELKISPANGNLLEVKEPIELPKQEVWSLVHFYCFQTA